jgi:aspartokinase/homoserine dehydrogenase 1
MVPTAFSLPTLTYDELMELSHFGAKVIYPPTVHPARERGIPLVIRNTTNPGFAGTRVVRDAAPGGHAVRGISSINDVALLRLEGDGMIGVPGIAARLFGALASAAVNVVLISQASSEHTICFAIAPESVPAARARIDEEFELERRAGLIDDVVVEDGLSVVAAVGSGMRERPGVAGQLFDALGDRAINVRAIAQGSSELNISLVVARADEQRALHAVHDAFFARETQPVSVFVAGVGRVGSALVRLIGKGHAIGRPGSGTTTMRVGGTCRSTEMRIGDSVELADLSRFARAAMGAPGPVVFVDCTASDAVPQIYDALLEAGIPVVSANKRPFSSSFDRFDALRRVASSGEAGLYFETTAGAGVPVLSAIRGFVEAGDTILGVEGVFSGTIAFLMSALRDGESFSEALRLAHEAGFTEPDPREDISGADIARKLLILARVAGFCLEPEDVTVVPLLADASLNAVPLEAFWQTLPSVDALFAEQAWDTSDRRGALCYLARFTEGQARVALDVVELTHPCATLHGTENVFVVRSERYAQTPLVIRGPGAGPEVTAAGVLADILAAVREVWHR